MNGNSSLLIDTNVALYYLGGDQTLSEIFDQKRLYVSFVVELELLGYANITSSDRNRVSEFLNDCTIIDINREIKDWVIELRMRHRIKLPDAIVSATSIYLDIPVITADSGFKKVEEIDLIHYEVS